MNFAKISEFLNQYKIIFLVFGLICLASGIFIDVKFEQAHDIKVVAASHFLLIFGEALIVFFLINAVLEEKNKREFLDETKGIMQTEKQKIIESFGQLSTQLLNDTKELVISTKDLITEEKQKVIDSFDELSKQLLTKTTTLVDKLNGDIFTLVLDEKTSPEVSKQIQQHGFFKSAFLKTEPAMKFKFVIDQKDPSKITQFMHDDFVVKNISKEVMDYHYPLKLTSSSSKSYKLLSARCGHDDSKMTEVSNDNWNIETKQNESFGKKFTLKEPIKINPDATFTVSRTIETTYIINPDGIDDFYYTKQYMMPFRLEVDVPEGYIFYLHPTFDEEKKEGPLPHHLNQVYKIPFLFPGQGFYYSVVKENSKQDV